MILSFRITKEQKEALLTLYPSIRHFVNKTIASTAEKILIEEGEYDTERELKEYHDRRVLNDHNIHGRRCTRATKDKISKTLKEKYKGKHYTLFEETKRLIGLKHRGKILSQTTKDAISKGNKGKKRTEEQRKNISIAKTGQKYKKRVRVN